ncbi:MAG: MmgE/PrpD family protein, partial [Myxococcaceae bacterium]
AARAQVLDMVAALHAAARSPEVACVLEGARAFSGDGGRSTVLATSERRGPADAALVNAACSMAQDFDDIVWMGHTCHSAVFSALAVAEHEEKTTGQLLLAVVAANEVAGRLGASSFLGPLNGQMWTFVHLIGAAAATSKLLGLDEEGTTHALAIALAQPNFALQPGFLKPGSKLLAAATPTATGIQAAYFARSGMTGAPGILEDPRGFWRRFSFLPMPFMLEGLGETWVLDTLTLKTFPGCHYFQTALTALERLRDRAGPLTLERVRGVSIDATKLACEATRFASEYEAGELTPVSVSFDLAQSAAVLLHAGRLGTAELESGYLARNAAPLRGWLHRIRVTHDPALTAKVLKGAKRLGEGRKALSALSLRKLASLRSRYAQEYRSTLFSFADLLTAARGALRSDAPETPLAEGVPLYFPARVTLELQDGRREIERVDLPVGSVASPGFAGELERKLVRELTPVFGESAARAALAAGLALENEPLERLVQRFAAPRAS